jgi:hypothetical protein
MMMRTSTDLRSDVAEHARRLLLETPYHVLRRVSCEYQAGELILRGELPTYFLKQMAQTAVANLPGVERVVNHIDVVHTMGEPALV